MSKVHIVDTARLLLAVVSGKSRARQSDKAQIEKLFRKTQAQISTAANRLERLRCRLRYLEFLADGYV